MSIAEAYGNITDVSPYDRVRDIPLDWNTAFGEIARGGGFVQLRSVDKKKQPAVGGKSTTSSADSSKGKKRRRQLVVPAFATVDFDAIEDLVYRNLETIAFFFLLPFLPSPLSRRPPVIFFVMDCGGWFNGVGRGRSVDMMPGFATLMPVLIEPSLVNDGMRRRRA
jgi:hypothetical protein